MTPRLARSDDVMAALITSGVIPAALTEPLGRLRRVVIDLQAGDARLLEVTPALAGAEIRRGGT